MQSITARHIQMFIQAFMLIMLFSVFAQGFGILRVFYIPMSALLVQFGLDKILKRKFNFQSALITSLSLLLLLKTHNVYYDILAVFLAISSKFVLRIEDQHLFNPANFAIVVFLFFDFGWVSPTQWGHNYSLIFILFGVGSYLCFRAKRLDVPLTFIIVTWLLLYHRHIFFLGDPFAIFQLKVSITTIYVFAFLMVSDPKTTPRNTFARILWVAMIAFMGFVIENHYFVVNGTLYVLFFFTPLIVLFNKFVPGEKYLWNS